MGDLPVLAEAAAEVAAESPHRKDIRSGIVVIKRLFFNWVNPPGGDFAVVQCIKFALYILACAADSMPFRTNFAVLRAEMTPYPPLIQLFIIQSFLH